ncbi:MAG TPA: hypothetical protein VM910_35995 [Bradyrhizobium sp.]|nr:hypothetical protein [Bradyrhizobium sp.]
MISDSEKQKLQAALEQLEIERQRRIEAKIESGEAVLRRDIAVVGVARDNGGDGPIERDAEGREIYYLVGGPDGRGTYCTRPMTIVTGVPRSGRDTPDPDPPVKFARQPSPTRKIRADNKAKRYAHPRAIRSAATGAAPAPEPVVREPKEIWIQLQAPDERNLAGVIARGVYRHPDSLVRVYDTDGNLLGSAPLRPGDSAEVAAKRLLREKGAAGNFYRPIRYPRGSVH